MPSPQNTGTRILRLWRRLSPLPGGRWLFHRILYRTVPYSGSVGSRVVRLESGNVSLRIRDRRAVRNHLRSIHAIALANVGELASGLALLTALPAEVRGIVTRLEVDFLRKARGRLTATSTVSVPPIREMTELEVTGTIEDDERNIVARVTVVWRLEPTSLEPKA